MANYLSLPTGARRFLAGTGDGAEFNCLPSATLIK
jgi:hypothetical protein